jgi:hypothetical protein
MIMPLAHAGHWLVNLIYMGPVIAIVAWISINSILERRRERREGHPTDTEPQP